MTRDEAIYEILIEGPYERWQSCQMEEKYNTWPFLFGIKDGVPGEGSEWYGEVESSYGCPEYWYFRPATELIEERWENVDGEHLDDEESSYTQAWVVLGYDVKAERTRQEEAHEAWLASDGGKAHAKAHAARLDAIRRVV